MSTGNLVLDAPEPAGPNDPASGPLGPDEQSRAIPAETLKAGTTEPLNPALRVRLHASDPVRRHGLTAILHAAGHVLTGDAPDVELCDQGQPFPPEAEAPVLALTSATAAALAGQLTPDATPGQLDAALRAVAAGLLVRSPNLSEAPTFAAAEDAPPLTPREREILALVGEGLSNKAMARRLGISIHTVKFHLEALFGKLDVTSRAEAVAKGLRGGVIRL